MNTVGIAHYESHRRVGKMHSERMKKMAIFTKRNAYTLATIVS